uniref:Uncharacterized protein n=1 Tax=uncultured bacterium 14 TaxID=1748267 RepID=A0A0U3JBE8_9BACT|nr:hypothetical protein [uncultured bacterium 14]
MQYVRSLNEKFIDMRYRMASYKSNAIVDRAIGPGV